MDVRQARTRSKLRNAIYAIAAEKHVNKISVAEVARAAEITRDTFYRHGTNPVELLASFLREDLDDLGRSIGELPATSGTKLSVFDEPERRLLSHIAERSEIYSNALSPRLAGELRDMLSDYIEQGLILHLERHPQIAPLLPGGLPPEEQRRMLVAYAGAGTVGAIEAWLRGENRGSVEEAARTVIAASPEWWLGRTAPAVK